MSWNDQNSGGNHPGPWGQGSSSPRGGGQHPPDLEEMLRRGQERLKAVLPSGAPPSRIVIISLLVLMALWAASGIYRVLPDEQGVKLRFGQLVETTLPGLHYHIPWPIETVLTPQVTRVNRMDIGIRGDDYYSQSPGVRRDVPEESLMLTGDENIVDVDFSVFWVIKNAGDYLFNVENPPATVKAVAESTMREIVGKSDIQPILTEQRQDTEEAVRTLMQETLDRYGTGIEITEVKMQKVDPPGAVIDAFRDVQAARADQERVRNEANAYRNKVVPESRGTAARLRNEAEAYREETVAQAEGQAQRFIAIYNEYRDARDVTRQRMFLETMERVLKRSDKIIIDSQAEGGQGVVPYLPLNELRRNPESEGGSQ